MTSELSKVQLRERLQDVRQEIARNLGVREEVFIEQTADAMDQIQAAVARELAIRSLDRSARWLRDVEEALRKVDTGDYGTCVNCDEEIGTKRLQAVPWAQLCLKCQDLADRSQSGERRVYPAERFMDAA